MPGEAATPKALNTARTRGPLGALRARATCRLRRAAPARATCRLRRAVPAPAARPVGGTVRVRACCRRSGPSSAPLRTLLTLAPRASGRLWRTRARFEGRLSSPGHLGGFSVLPAYIWRVPGEPQLPHGLQLQAERGAVCVTSRRSRASCLRLPPTAVCRASASARLEGRRGALCAEPPRAPGWRAAGAGGGARQWRGRAHRRAAQWQRRGGRCATEGRAFGACFRARCWHVRAKTDAGTAVHHARGLCPATSTRSRPVCKRANGGDEEGEMF